MVTNGYKLPFKVVPESAELKNNKSARSNPSFVEKEIVSLVKKGVVSEVLEKPHVVYPLTVAYNRHVEPEFWLSIGDLKVIRSLCFSTMV